MLQNFGFMDQTVSLPTKSISIVAPCFNEQDCLEAFYQALSQTVAKLTGYQFEFILVDDGSHDQTFAIAQKLARQDNRVKIISFSRNFGHQSALLAGMDAASGQAVITMDSDLQHPPELIPQLVQSWEQGFDIVSALRRDTADATLFKKMASRGFYSFINRISSIAITPTADFRLMDRLAVDGYLQLREYHRFNRGLIDWIGFRTTTIPFEAPARFAGQTKFSVVRMARFALHALVSFSVFPLRLAIFLGLFIAFLAGGYAIYAVYAMLVLRSTLPGWTSLAVTMLLLGGVQLICLGLVGEYVGKIFEEAKHRPLYVIRRREGFDPPPSSRPKSVIQESK